MKLPVDFTEWQVLLVDDDMQTLQLLEIAFKKRGITVHKASSAAQALEILAQHNITVVVTDLSMPGIDGWELLKRIRADQKTADLPVIALTAAAMTDAEEKILGAGFTGFMRKPLKIMTFVDDLIKQLKTVENSPD